MNYRWILLLVLIFIAGSTHAQLRIHGAIYSEGPVQVALSIETYHETHFMYIDTLAHTRWKGEEVYKSNYSLPWAIVKDYNHTIKFTDGTVEKTIFVHGLVPDDIVPKQNYTVDIDLIDVSTADMLLIVFWSLPDDSYIALPYSDLEIIKMKCMNPEFWDQDTPGIHFIE